MGIIVKQSIKGGIWSYLGVIIGFVTTSYLYTEYLTTDVVGLFGLLVAYASLTGQLFLFGIQGVTARLFPYFRDRETQHNGFLFISTLVFILGFSVFLLVYYAFKPVLVESNLEKSALFAEYVYLLIPLTFFSMAFVFLDTYNRLLYDAVSGTFYQEFLQRLLLFLIVVLFALGFIDLHQLVLAYGAAVSLKGLFIFILLLVRGEINLRPKLGFIDKKLKKEIWNVAFYSILTSLGSIFVFNIDRIVVNQMLDLSNTGVYTIAFYFGTLVIIPSRPLLKIAGTLIAEAWAKNDLQQIKDIYYKSCINQFLIGCFLFLGIWANIDNILAVLGPDYLRSKWVIFFIAIGNLFDMMTGANSIIISYSKHYRMMFAFTIILIVAVLVMLYLFIPLWGITGAAIAIAATLWINNLMRYIFLYRKYRMQPFNMKFLLVAAFFTGVYFLLELIPQQQLIIDILVRGSVITVLSGLFVIVSPVSEDITSLLNKLKERVYKR